MSRQLTDSRGRFAIRVTELYAAHGVGPVPFEDVLDEIRPQTDDELVEVIEADAAEMIVRNQPVTVSRYRPFAEGRPQAWSAALEACADSHYELDEMSREEAQRVAHSEARGCGRGSARRPLPRRRRRLVGGTVTVPVPIVTILVIVAVLAMGLMGQSLYAANLKYERAQAAANLEYERAQAAAEAEYKRGERETLVKLQERQAALFEREHQLRLRQEKLTKDLAASVKYGVKQVENEMAEGRVRKAVEILVGIEQIVIGVHDDLPSIPAKYSRLRLDSLIMPLLGTIYEHVNPKVRQEALTEVRNQLQRLEDAWFVDIRPDESAEQNHAERE